MKKTNSDKSKSRKKVTIELSQEAEERLRAAEDGEAPAEDAKKSPPRPATPIVPPPPAPPGSREPRPDPVGLTVKEEKPAGGPRSPIVGLTPQDAKTSRELAVQPRSGAAQTSREIVVPKAAEAREADVEAPADGAQAPLLALPDSGGRTSGRIASEMLDDCEQDISRLSLLELEQQERLQVIRGKQSLLESELADTQLGLSEARETLEALREPEESSIKLKVKTEKLGDVQEEIRKVNGELESLRQRYEEDKRRLHATKTELELEVAKIQRDILILERELRPDEAPPGPRALGFLDSVAWQAFAAVVILGNVLTVLWELTHPGDGLVAVNSAFLVFFLIELLLNLVYKRQTFFMGKPSVVLWGWLDFVLVLCGGVGFVADRTRGAVSHFVGLLRTLRLVRLARAGKVIKMLLHSDLSWVEGHAFQASMMTVIGVNALVMGLETHFMDFALWPVVEYIFLAIYLVELLLRLMVHHWSFFWQRRDFLWNWLDLLIVVGAIVDMCVPTSLSARDLSSSPGQAAAGHLVLAQVITVLRVARLARLLRIAGLVKGIPRLYAIAAGIVEALESMGWVLVLTVSLLYVCSLVGVKLVGQGWALPDGLSKEDMASAQGCFADITEAFFNLFRVMYADLGGVEPLIELIPASRWLLMAFMVMTNGAIFSVLIAVCNGNMAKVTEDQSRQSLSEQEEAAAVLREGKLRMLLRRLDAGSDGEFSRSELQALLADEVHAVELTGITGYARDDLEDISGVVFSEEGDATKKISCREFVSLLNKERRHVTLRSVMRIEKTLHEIQRHIKGPT